MNTEDNNTSAPQWAVVELMGHIRYGGMVQKDNMLGTAMLRVDVPQGDGQFVTQMINPSSIYRITFCSEEIARVAAANGRSLPISEWELRDRTAAPSPVPQLTPGDINEDEDDDYDINGEFRP